MKSIYVLFSAIITLSPNLIASEPLGPSLVLERNPYLQLSTPNSIVIQWSTDVPSDSRVEFGLDPAALTQSAVDTALTTEHSVTLSGLTPDTTYYYAVGSSTQTLAGGDAEHSFRSAPIAGTPKPVRVWVVGDAGVGSPGARDVRDAYLAHAADHPADIWLMLGDNAYLLGSDSDFQTRMFDIYPSILRTTVSWPTIGNHDVLDSQRPYFDIFTLPDTAQAGGVASNTELYYSFEYANIHFICLDTTLSDFTAGSPMLDWLAADLAATTQDWAIAYFHHPPYSDGHDSDEEDELIEVRENIIPILEAGGVDLVLSGHSHSYERSFLLNGHYGLSSTLTPAMLIDDGNGQEDGDGAYTKSAAGLTPNSGTVYVVAGNAGQLTGLELNHPAMASSHIELGSMVLDIHNNRLDAVSITDQGVINDHFTIVKPAACPPDINSDGVVDFFDISQFLVTRPDWNSDTAFDFFDINSYLTAYSKGCP
ncbi:MAG: metallophosphoesterase [Phycisphaerales bacterium]